MLRVAVEATSVNDLPKLERGLRRLHRADPAVEVETSGRGEQVKSEVVVLKSVRKAHMQSHPLMRTDAATRVLQLERVHGRPQIMQKYAFEGTYVWPVRVSLDVHFDSIVRAFTFNVPFFYPPP